MATPVSALDSLALSVALGRWRAAFTAYKSAETCWRLTRSIRAAAADKNARVALVVARKQLDDASEDLDVASERGLAANSQAA
jgi:hypothetical protein